NFSFKHEHVRDSDRMRPYQHLQEWARTTATSRPLIAPCGQPCHSGKRVTQSYCCEAFLEVVKTWIDCPFHNEACYRWRLTAFGSNSIEFSPAQCLPERIAARGSSVS